MSREVKKSANDSNNLLRDIKGRIHGYAHVRAMTLSKQFIGQKITLECTEIEKSVQSKLQMAEFNKRFSRMTRTMSATNLVLTRRIYS